jgi:signal peptidase I
VGRATADGHNSDVIVDPTGSGDPAVDDRATLRHVAWFVGIVLVVLLVRTFVAEYVRVSSNSMEPTISSGEILVIDKLTYRLRDPRVGEIVVTEDPRSGEDIVKRVVAVGGQSVGIENGELIRDGAVVDEPFADHGEMDGFYFGPIEVPAGMVFVLGDNRDTSVDSRAFGPLPVEAVDGRLAVRVWPPVRSR